MGPSRLCHVGLEFFGSSATSQNPPRLRPRTNGACLRPPSAGFPGSPVLTGLLMVGCTGTPCPLWHLLRAHNGAPGLLLLHSFLSTVEVALSLWTRPSQLGTQTFCAGEGRLWELSYECRTPSSVLGLHPLDAGSVSPTVTAKRACRHYWMSPGGPKHRAENHCSGETAVEIAPSLSFLGLCSHSGFRWRCFLGPTFSVCPTVLGARGLVLPQGLFCRAVVGQR